MIYRPVRCNDCDCLLWSDESKKLKLCPECRWVDEEGCGNLEERLEKLFENE